MRAPHGWHWVYAEHRRWDMRSLSKCKPGYEKASDCTVPQPGRYLNALDGAVGICPTADYGHHCTVPGPCEVTARLPLTANHDCLNLGSCEERHKDHIPPAFACDTVNEKGCTSGVPGAIPPEEHPAVSCYPRVTGG